MAKDESALGPGRMDDTTGSDTMRRFVRPALRPRTEKYQEHAQQGHSHPDHPQAVLSVGDMQAEVDEGLVDILRPIWQLGWKTTASCEMLVGNEDQAYISFDTTEWAKNFFDLIHRHVSWVEWFNSRNNRVAVYFPSDTETFTVIRHRLTEKLAEIQAQDAGSAAEHGMAHNAPEGDAPAPADQSLP